MPRMRNRDTAAIVTTTPREMPQIASEEAPDTSERRLIAVERRLEGNDKEMVRKF